MGFFRRRRWPLIEGRLIYRRHIKNVSVKYDSFLTSVSIDEYMVEFPGPDGRLARLAITAKSVKLPVRSLEIGQKVPIHVNRRGTKAIFGSFYRGENKAERKRREKERRAEGEARFKERLDKL